MNLTDYHANLFAHELTRRCPTDSDEKLAGAIVDAGGSQSASNRGPLVCLSFAPVERGALADEVGLGKTKWGHSGEGRKPGLLKVLGAI